ncbi:hypothetical protein ACFWY6_44200 [Streptomyces sp. NPDC059037]|uniref:hypothetical protein n=1 Tax=Streptomyces sp. NPDC059037 TaxID=3346710 RepID=UPI0036B1E816
MTSSSDPAAVILDHDQAAALARLLRQIEQFFDECDDDTEDALAAYSGLNPASEAFSAALCFHADAIEAALSNEPDTSRTPTRRIHAVQSQPGQIDSR